MLQNAQEALRPVGVGGDDGVEELPVEEALLALAAGGGRGNVNAADLGNVEVQATLSEGFQKDLRRAKRVA